MAIKACKECGNEVAESAPTCPSCGVESPGKTFVWPKGRGIGCGTILAAFILFAIWKGNSSDSSAPTQPLPEAKLCSPSDFTVDKFRSWVDDINVIHLVGTVTNNCTSSHGIALTWKAFHKDGTIVFTDDVFVNGLKDIGPGQSAQFEELRPFPTGGRISYSVTPTKIFSLGP